MHPWTYEYVQGFLFSRFLQDSGGGDIQYETDSAEQPESTTAAGIITAG